MNDKQLIEKCQPVLIKERIVFHSNVQYGFSKVIRKMGFYPSFLPICAYFEHSSPPFYDENWYIKKEFLSDIFFHRKDFANQWNKKYKGKARTFKSPFVFFKEKNKIEISKDATGSLFFIHHSRLGVERDNDQKKILEKINNLEPCFHPVSFCFYYLDILQGNHIAYQKLGYNIVTAGDKDNPDFIENFYSLVVSFKYAITNSIGGHLLFLTNLGMPVSYFEDLEPVHRSKILGFDESRVRLENSKIYQEAKRNFQGVQKNVTKEKLDFVNKMLGVKGSTSRLLIFFILYKSFFLYLIYKIKKKIRQNNS